MKRVGPHVSAAGGVQNAPLNAKSVGAEAFALFTKNQRQWFAKNLSNDDIDSFKKNMESCGYNAEHVLPHDSYLINLGNPDMEKRKRSLGSFIHELERCGLLGLKYLNTHPGSHLNAVSESECLNYIADGINRALEKTDGVTVVLETTSGQGSNVGYRFEHLAAVIEKVEDKARIGVCFDTCHAFSAGYEIRKEKEFNRTFTEFDNVIGLKYLKGMHINDSKVEFGSRKDRHQSIGKGTLGLDPFRFIMNDPRFDEIPLILETIDDGLWPAEIKMLYGLITK